MVGTDSPSNLAWRSVTVNPLTGTPEALRARSLGSKNLKTCIETCKPRDEVQRRAERERFAASLTKVLRHQPEETYGDPTRFAANIDPTGGLKSLLHEALGRDGSRAMSHPTHPSSG
jgi:hypothetical protein